jgi:hypothetical protein
MIYIGAFDLVKALFGSHFVEDQAYEGSLSIMVLFPSPLLTVLLRPLMQCLQQ